MELLYALLGGLVVLFFLKKDNSTEARAENLETKEKILEIEKEKIKTDVAIQSEEIKREELKKEITEKTNEVLSPEDLVDFFNNRKP
jgi:hypothetical protein